MFVGDTNRHVSETTMNLESSRSHCIFTIFITASKIGSDTVRVVVVVTRHASHVTRHTSHVTRHTSHVTRHTSHITRHTSHVTRHSSHVTRHSSRVTRHTGSSSTVKWACCRWGGRGGAGLRVSQVKRMPCVRLRRTSHVTRHTSHCRNYPL